MMDIKDVIVIERIRKQLNTYMPFSIDGWPYDTEEVQSLLKGPQSIYDDSELNDSYNCAILLNYYRTQIAALGEYSLTDVLYSWYYWFAKFLARYEPMYGKDESMRQQLFKVIEALDYAVAENNEVIDCDLLETIEHDLGFSSID